MKFGTVNTIKQYRRYPLLILNLFKNGCFLYLDTYPLLMAFLNPWVFYYYKLLHTIGLFPSYMRFQIFDFEHFQLTFQT